MANKLPNTRIFGAEWVNDYSHPFNPIRTSLLRCYQNAKGFCDALALLGTKRFNFGDSQAWDTDLEQKFLPNDNNAPPLPLIHGEDDIYAEKVDMLFFTGHGSQAGLMFGVPSADNGEARYNEMQLGQGGKIKWFVVDACKVLEETGVVFRWSRIFKGLRYMLGFHGDCRDTGDRGLRFANHLNGVITTQAQQGGGSSAHQGETIWRAWELACIETETASNLSCACLRAGGPNSVIHKDRWTDAEVDKDPSTAFTYWRNVYQSAI